MQYIKWILLGVCLLAVVWPLLFKQPDQHPDVTKPEQKDQ